MPAGNFIVSMTLTDVLEFERTCRGEVTAALQKAERGQWGESADLSGVAAEELHGMDAVLGEDVVDIPCEVLADGLGWNGETRGPLFDEVVDVGEAVIAGRGEVFGELGSGNVARAKRFRADGPDGGDPGESGAGMPLMGEVDPFAGADGLLDLGSGFERDQGGVADEQGGISLLEHGDGIGGMLNKSGLRAEEFAKEDFGIRE